MGDDGLLRVGEVLDGVGARLGLGRAAEVGVLWRCWPEIVGPAIAEHAEPTSLRNGVLRIRADSPAWANELTYLGPEIRRRANELTQRPAVADVRVWTGPGEVTRRGQDRGEPGAVPEPSRSARDDPFRAFERARRAWAKRRRSGLSRPS